ncbi:hypothetical protein [Streptacidiphilus monticola]|uniref:DUF308 domain-containing protein n=1 Tax=Streptacidiphilus monticola TaxID=2161674 RepID=A0ABW1FYX4_9ACTN
MAEPDAANGGQQRKPTDDEVFAELVAGFDAPAERSEHDWPDAEDTGDTGDADGYRDLTPRPVIRPLPVVRAVPPVDPRAWSPAEDPDEFHFVPPEPPPIPKAQTVTRVSLLALVAGVALLLLSGFGQVPGLAGFLGAASLLGGIAGLVSRLHNPDDDDDRFDDPNHGAVV